MAKSSGVTYTQVADTCKSLLRDGQTIKLRSITAITGGSPNAVLKHWQQWQQEQAETTLKELEEDLSAEVKQAIRAECTRKMRLLKEQHEQSRTNTLQQITDMQSQLDETHQAKEDLQLDIAVTKNELEAQQRRTELAEQRMADYAKRLNEMEKQYIQSEKATERALTEKTMLEKQLRELQERVNHLEQQHALAMTGQHRAELELAGLKATHK